jgi:hypothetical protein
MRRDKPRTNGRVFPVFPILAAGLIGYLIGGWHPAALRASSDPSAADTVALRFPQAWEKISQAAAADNAVPESGVLHDAATTISAPANVSDVQLALLDPQPMIPQAHPPIAQAALDPTPQARVQLASAEAVAPAATLDSHAATPPEVRPIAATQPQQPVKSAAAKSMEPKRTERTEPKSLAPKSLAPKNLAPKNLAPKNLAPKNLGSMAPRRSTNRPGYMLDDAQIASIKERLHLTPDQEQMWPAVEVALRNIAYTRAQQARDRTMQPADIDPESVDGLKSAAVPLILSFNEEQKQEVRDLAHVMGLDQLASQF